ncbi:MAG: glutamate--tRNA ligase [Proteobacteria bacterium]|nr:glutamate--tRNA ligase [Pseudomonadota bacterium]
MTVVTRFAPSPTGFLHIGGARTALFNWLFSKHHGGKFMLRIEDTDRKRSTPEAVEAILDGLKWLELNWDGETYFQSQHMDRHVAVVNDLLASGNAYRCYCSPEELAEMRETAKSEGRSIRYDGRWRDRDPSEAPAGVSPAIRLKAPQDGETVIEDLVQGAVRVANSQLDDMILLRSDGTPTYMLSVVVDDHDMGITHVIRGDDHLTNASRQTQLFQACGWKVPVFAHIPLIHGADGQKLSKRHGALGVDAYRDMGYLPAALRNYLLRLGWSHGDDEIIETDQAIEWFDMDSVGKAAARFDFAKLDSINSHYLRAADPAALAQMVMEKLAGKIPDDQRDIVRERLAQGLPALAQRVKSLNELVENAGIYVAAPQYPLANAKAAKLLDAAGVDILARFSEALAGIETWTDEAPEEAARQTVAEQNVGLGALAQPMRAALTGSNASPGIFEVIGILGKDETLARLKQVPGMQGALKVICPPANSAL